MRGDESNNAAVLPSSPTKASVPGSPPGLSSILGDISPVCLGKTPQRTSPEYPDPT